jgi:hypothetical protein
MLGEHFKIRNPRREHRGMFPLQSDFSRHFLTKLLDAAELRTFICCCMCFVLCHFKATPIAHTVLKQSSRPGLERLNLPMSLNPFPYALSSLALCFFGITVLEMQRPVLSC